MTKFLSQHRRLDAEAVRDFVGQFVAHDAAGHALNVRQQVVQRLDLAFWCTHGMQGPGTLDEVVEILLRMGECLTVGVAPFRRMYRSGSKPASSVKYLDLEVFAHQQRE